MNEDKVEMPFSKQQIEEFNRNGYLISRNMAPADTCDLMLSVAAEHLRCAVPPLEYEATVGYPGAPESLDAIGGRTARRLRDAYHRHDCFRAWAQNPDLVGELAQLFGEDVYLSLAHHNCVMTKHPDFGTATGWHRDIRYWSFTKPDLICVWLALGSETSTNGGLKFIPGSHHMAIRPEQLDALDFLRPDLPQNQQLFRQGVALDLQKGDVVFFHSRLFHAAGRNNSSDIKTSVAFAYHGTSNQPVEGSKSAAAGEVFLGS